jgi:transposase InsO family protein
MGISSLGGGRDVQGDGHVEGVSACPHRHPRHLGTKTREGLRFPTTRAYLHAVIDDSSRRILAWRVADRFEPTVTAELLLRVSRDVLDNERPTLLTEGGIQNYDSAVDELLETDRLRRLLAMTDITYSSSLIESWWRSLEHPWLYLPPTRRVVRAGGEYSPRE